MTVRPINSNVAAVFPAFGGNLHVVKIGLCGLGTVASGVVNLFARNRELFSERAATPLQIVHIGARRDNPDCDTGAIKVSRDIFAVARDPQVDIVVELIGGTATARELVLEAIANGKHVVTANKALIAEYGDEIFRAAADRGVQVAFEASVAGGIPIIKGLREGLAANQIELLVGIINGTTNFILTEMAQKGRTFEDVLTQAQELGYAEADPTFDVEGIDAAHKLVILASIAFGIPLPFGKVLTEGITSLQQTDVKHAAELGYVVKHLAIARRNAEGLELRVHPTLVPEKALIGKIDGVLNAVYVEGDACGPVLFSGAGAGSAPTASSVVSDLIDLGRDLVCQSSHDFAPLGKPMSKLVAMPLLSEAEIETSFYLRITALDRPGVLSNISQIMSEAGISIESIIQKDQPAGEEFVDIIILTSITKQRAFDGALSKIEALESVREPCVHLHLERLGK